LALEANALQDEVSGFAHWLGALKEGGGAWFSSVGLLRLVVPSSRRVALRRRRVFALVRDLILRVEKLKVTIGSASFFFQALVKFRFCLS
jgi:hypothetical protein